MQGKQVFNNAKWIVVCKILQSLLQLVVGMLCARYLGPSNYGLINYAASIVAFAMPLMKLGLDSTLVHELVESPEDEGEIIGTSLVMNLVSSICCMLGVTAFVSVANKGETTTIIVCALYSISLLFAAVEMIQYWFQYKLQSKYSSIIMLVAYVFVSAYRIYLLVTSKSVYWFALTHSIEFSIIGISLIIVYFKRGAMRFKFSLNRAKTMFKKSKHYIIASLMVVVFQSTDHIMLTMMVNKQENGFYTAAITSATMLQFVYIAIIDSFRPMILSNKKEEKDDYKTMISQLYCIIVYLSLAQSIVFTVFSKLIITILYGNSYLASVNVLRVLIWHILFSCIGVVRNVWILAEQKQKYLWMINLTGALFNIVINAFAIPVLGAVGASIATVFTQFFTNFILGFIFKPIRENNILLLRGLNPRLLFDTTFKILSSLRKK